MKQGTKALLMAGVSASLMTAGGATALLTKDTDGDQVEKPEVKSTEEQALEVKQMLDNAVDAVKAIAEDALGKAKSGEALGKTAKGDADKALTKMGELDTAFKALEKKLAAGEALSEAIKSAGDQFVDSDEFKALNGGVMQKGQAIGHKIKTISSLTTDADGSMGAHIRPHRVVSPMATLPQRRLFIRELLAPGQTDSNLIEYVQETGFVNNAAIVEEMAQKPESSLKSELVDAKVKKIAHLMHASMEILQDVPALRSMINQRLGYGLEFILEQQILNGDGTGSNLNGIMSQATVYAKPSGAVVSGETQIDRLRLAFLQAALAEYSVDGSILNPIDWANIEMLKDTDGRYIIGNPQGTTSPTLWGRSVVPTQAQSVGTFLTGAFRQGAQLFDRMQTMIAASTENKDNFEKNIVTILAEMRVALAVYRPEAFVKGDFTALGA